MPKARSGKTGQGVLMSLGAAGLLGAGALGLATSQHVAKVAPNTVVASLDVSGLTSSEAAEKIKAWFDKTASNPLKLTSEYLEVQPSGLTAKDMGAAIDLEKTMAKLPMEGFWEEAQRRVGLTKPTSRQIKPVFEFDEAKLAELGDFVEENMKAGRPARAFLRGGTVVREKEIPGMEVAEAKLSDAVAEAMLSGAETDLPMEIAPKRVPDDKLEKIVNVMGRYATSFNAGQRDRSSNIRLAASILDGLVLMPGEEFSFNRAVGRRTASGGFKRAGVFVNGRKEYDIGGGICQVSTTLYNAALLSNLAIPARSSHSRPVPYVPIGRDAAVSYPNPDLKIKNNADHPIAFAASVNRGKIEFAVLGQRVEGQSISIVQGRVSSSDNGVKTVEDPGLGFGQTKVIESGAARRSVATWRVVTRDGREVARESLGTSFYRGTPRIVARNSKAKAPAAAATTASTSEAAPATPTPSSGSAPQSPTSPTQPQSDQGSPAL